MNQWRRIWKLAAISLLFCCQANQKSWEYPSLGLKITRTSAWEVLKRCDNIEKWDDGRQRQKGSPVSGCYLPKTGDIYIYNSDSIIHELCHADGQPREVCDK